MASETSPARISIYDAAAANRWRTVLLVVAFTAIIAMLGYFVGEYFYPGGGLAVLPIVLAQSQARELAPNEETELHNFVETLAIGLGIPVPKLFVIEDSAPNAFATGRDPRHASVVVTRGLLDKMDRTELEGVIAHELSHVGNRDIRVMLLVTILVGTVALLSDWLMRSMFWGG